MPTLDLSAAINQMPIIFFIMNADGVFEVSLGKTLEIIGLKPGEAVGKSFRDLYATFPEVIESCESALQGKQSTRFVSVGNITFETLYQPIKDDDGKITHVVGLSTDATAKVRATKELEEMNKAMVGRELAMVKLKNELAELKNRKS